MPVLSSASVEHVARRQRTAPRWHAGHVRGFVLVGGWPGSGKTTLSRSLATELGLPLLSKDEVKEALMDALGAPADVEESAVSGGRLSSRCWQRHEGAPVRWSTAPGTRTPRRSRVLCRVRSSRCAAGCRSRRHRTVTPRGPGRRHLDGRRSSSELWGDEVAPLGLGHVLDVDTSGPVDVAEVATSCRALLDG